MKKIFTIVVITAFSLSWYSCQQTKDAVIEAALRKEAEEFNKTGGKMLDNDIRMDSMSVAEGKILIGYYTLVNYEKEDLDTAVIKEAMRPEMAKALATNKELALARKNKVSFKYYYYDKKGRYAFRMNFIAKDYIAK